MDPIADLKHGEDSYYELFEIETAHFGKKGKHASLYLKNSWGLDSSETLN